MIGFCLQNVYTLCLVFDTMILFIIHQLIFFLSFNKYLIGIKGIYLNLTVHPILIIFCQTSKDQKSLDLLAVLKNRKDKFGWDNVN